MLCLDMKLVSRLRGLSSTNTASSGTNSADTSVQLISSSSSSLSSINDKKRRTPNRNGHNNASSSISDRDSDDDISPTPRILRDRSRSVCMPVLTASQMRHLHRRASQYM